MHKLAGLFLFTMLLGGMLSSGAGTITTVSELPSEEENLLTGGEWQAEYGKWSTEKTMDGEPVIALSHWVQLYYSKPIKVEPGYRYCFAVKAKVENFSFLKKHHYGFGFGLEQFRSEMDRNGNWYEMYAYGIYGEGDHDWTAARGSWIPKDTTVWLRPAILVKSDISSKAWLKELVIWKEPLQPKSSSKLSNIIENGSFEIVYSVDTTPFGYWLFDPSGKRMEFGTLAVATKQEAALQASCLLLKQPCQIQSSSGKLEGDTLTAVINVLPRNLGNGKFFAKINLLDANGILLATLPIGEISAVTNDWRELKREFDCREFPAGTVAAQVELAVTGTLPLECYVDDLRLQIHTPLQGLPHRPYRPDSIAVTVDVSRKGKLFTSPLDSYDHHCADRIYSYSIGTAGPHLEGPGRWFEMRHKLGIRYVRLHNGFDSGLLTEHLPVAMVKEPEQYFHSQNGETGVCFCASRINPKTGKPFPPVVTIDADGTMHTDFSGIGYYLDNSILKGGCRPIFGLEPVPAALAINNDTHQPPKDMKRWREFVAAFFRWLVDKYGKDEIRQWIFETGNEPSTEWTFHGRGDRSNVLNDFLEMQDYTIAGAQDVLPEVVIAGPSGPPRRFFLPLLKHAANGLNYATGKVGTKLDAISYHGYLGGTPQDLSWRFSEEEVFAMMRYRDYYEKLTGKTLQVWNTEFAAIFLEVTPKEPPANAYDNHIQAIATLHMANFSYRAGVERMVFFYHSPTYFAPVRGDWNFKKSPNQATTSEFVGEPTMRTFHGVIKPVARIFQLLSWLNGGREIATAADAEPIYSLAVKDGNAVKLLLYSFDVDPTQTYSSTVTVKFSGLEPKSLYRVIRNELNSRKANSWYLATRDQITQKECEDDISVVDRLNRESEFKPEHLSPVIADQNGVAVLQLNMPVMSASLLELTPDIRK